MSCYGGGADVVPVVDEGGEYMEQVDGVNAGMYVVKERRRGRETPRTSRWTVEVVLLQERF